MRLEELADLAGVILPLTVECATLYPDENVCPHEQALNDLLTFLAQEVIDAESRRIRTWAANIAAVNTICDKYDGPCESWVALFLGIQTIEAPKEFPEIKDKTWAKMQQLQVKYMI